MIFQHTRLSGVTVLATGVATIVLLMSLLYAYATARLDFLQALSAAILVFTPIGLIGAVCLARRFAPPSQFYREIGG